MIKPVVDIIELLNSNKLTISTCESLTGGMVGSSFVSVPRASSVYKGTIVCYSNDIKTNLVGVKQNTINKFGVVSKEVAIEMADLTNKKMKTDICVSITGNAGPEALENKPIGLAYISISLIDINYIYEVQAPNLDREDIRVYFTAWIFDKLIQTLKNIGCKCN